MKEAPKYQLEQRTLEFSVRVIKHCARLKQPAIRSVNDQLIRSATSIGANYAEANNAASKTDFRSKIYIAKKEAAETKYWLRLLKELDESSEEILMLLEEVQRILMTLQKIVNTLNSAPENGKPKTQGKLKTENRKT